MGTTDPAASAALLRRVLDQNASSQSAKPASADFGSLERMVEGALLRAGTLAPITPTAERALIRLATLKGVESLTDEDLTSAWLLEIERVSQQFALDPESWSGDGSEQFLRQVAVTFGVFDDKAATLVQIYHSLSLPVRLGIQVRLIRSSYFSYVLRVIDEMEDADDIEIESPEEAVRSLMKAVNTAE